MLRKTVKSIQEESRDGRHAPSRGQYLAAGAYILASVVVSIAALYAGLALMRMLLD